MSLAFDFARVRHTCCTCAYIPSTSLEFTPFVSLYFALSLSRDTLVYIYIY
jgi:hypothetical protein